MSLLSSVLVATGREGPEKQNAPAQGTGRTSGTRERTPQHHEPFSLRRSPALDGTFGRGVRLTTATAATSGLWVELREATVRGHPAKTKSPGPILVPVRHAPPATPLSQPISGTTPVPSASVREVREHCGSQRGSCGPAAGHWPSNGPWVDPCGPADPHEPRGGRAGAGPRGPAATGLAVVPEKDRKRAGGIAAARVVLVGAAGGHEKAPGDVPGGFVV
ncbi:hypothetical protein GCM10023107_40330 [Actinoplanes octamycinicus]|nr:hypothetical protein Aoc01nite_86440 [Actinoplanes octamycinicus]